MKLGIVGSRRRNTGEDYLILVARVTELQPDMIISGGCPKGADNFAEKIAKELGIPITIYYPKIRAIQGAARFGKIGVIKAMYARNLLIATHSDHLIALVAPDRKGGTENTIKYFKNHGMGEEELEIL